MSTLFLKRKKEMLYVPRVFESGLAIDALVDSTAFVSSNTKKKVDRMKEQGPKNIFKNDVPLIFQIQVANGQLEKLLATATLKFDIGDKISDDHFVVMKILTEPIIETHFMRHNSVVIDTTFGLIHFSLSKMQVRSAAIKLSAKPLVCLHVHYPETATYDYENNHSLC